MSEQEKEAEQFERLYPVVVLLQVLGFASL
jgi:hypothetical protein